MTLPPNIPADELSAHFPSAYVIYYPALGQVLLIISTLLLAAAGLMLRAAVRSFLFRNRPVVRIAEEARVQWRV